MDLPEKRKPGTSTTVRKLVAIIILTSSVIAFFITLIQLFMEYRDDLSRLNETVSEINVTQTDTLGHLIWNLDEVSIQIVINNNIKIKGIEYAELKTFENKVWSAGKVISDSTLTRIFPVYAPGLTDKRLKVGDLKIIAGKDHVFRSIIKKGFYVLLGNTFKTILVAIVAILSVKFIISRHLIYIADHINSIFEGNFSKKLSLKRRTSGKEDELDLIVSALNSMAEKLEHSFRDLKREVERREANEIALLKSENRLRSALDHIPDAVIIYSKELKIEFVNTSASVLTGRDSSFYIGKRDEEVWPKEVYSKYINELKEAFYDGKIKRFEADILLNDKINNLIITIVPIKGQDDKVNEALLIGNDITEKTDLETQLNHARKMESIGILAGGIAHDFNNILSIIIGYGQLLEESIPRGTEDYYSINEINNAAERAKNLTKQLLAFSRKQVLHIETVDINTVIDKFQKLLGKLINEDVLIRYELNENPGFVKVDVSQLEQVLLNLVINASDAIEEGGEILIETDTVYLDRDYSMKKVETEPGSYVMLSVSDTGKGMENDLLDFIFDPFFTTKEIGKGTGLGLSTVYGIVKQHNGNIWVYSEPGKGSVFKIYLPLVEEEKRIENEIRVEEFFEETGTIMIVEDEDRLKGMIHKILSDKGFSVISTISSGEAVEKASEIGREIDLVITDVIMPDMNGPEVFKKVKEFHPEAEVLYMSGYSGNLISKQGVLGGGINFMQKPFSREEILKKVDQILSQKRSRSEKRNNLDG